jgi:hypothetical protein
VLTGNYGEAGALERFAPDLALVFSGHNGYGYWGPPPDGAAPVVVVGRWRDVGGLLAGCRQVGVIENAHDLDNDEDGAPIQLCDGPARPWRDLWPDVQRLG